MYINDANRIQNIIASLKEVKHISFSYIKDSVDFKKVTETCRILDTFMLPLYYMWEQYCHKQLEDIGFEEHLKKPYQRFIQNPKLYTREILLFITLTLGTPFFIPLNMDIVIKISEMYYEIINHGDAPFKRPTEISSMN